jgi:hypothetical protein
MRPATEAVLALALIAGGCATSPAARPAAPSSAPPAAAAAPAQPAPAQAGPATTAAASGAAAAAAGADAEPVTCRGTLSGAVTGAFTCTVSARIEGQSVAFSIVPENPVAGVATLVPAAFELAAPLRSTTYAREALQAGEAVVIAAAGERFVASGRRGEIALVLHEVQRYGQGTPRPFYVVSGTLRAKLTADKPGAGDVVVDVRF